jgi:glycosyltransferase involved in cell wall biosynthesis
VGRHIAVITAFPPSRETLNEYGYHLVTALAAKVDVDRVTVLAPELAGGDAYPEIDRVTFEEAWRFNGVTTPLRLARALRRLRPDAAIFNAHFSSFGTSRLSAAAGLTSPLLARLVGIRTITLLHNIVETVDLSQAGFRFGRTVESLMRAIGTALTWLVLRSHLVTVTIPSYVEVLRAKYRAGNVALVPHGSFDIPPEPEFSVDLDRPQRIVAFGKFGTYKRVEDLITAYRELAPGRNLELVIAGTDSPNAPGYLAEVEQRLGGEGITFTGYVAEEDVPGLFTGAAVAVFPYTATTGSSGVLHQAGSYGCAAVLPNIGDFAAVIGAEGYRGEFFEPGNPGDLAQALARVLDDPAHRAGLGRRNYLASRGLPIAEVADWYLVHADPPRRRLAAAA